MARERKQKPLTLSAITAPNINIVDVVKDMGGRRSGQEFYNVSDKFDRRIEEHFQEYILGKDVGGEGAPEFYSIRYWPTKFSEDSWTKLYHLGHKLGEDQRDMEVSTTDPYTSMESLQKIGFKQLLVIEFDVARFKYHNFEIILLHSNEGIDFVETRTTYREKDEIDQKEKVDKMILFLKKLGIGDQNIFMGSALQYYIYLKNLPIPIEGQKYMEDKIGVPPQAAPEPELPPEIMKLIEQHPEWQEKLQKGEIPPELEKELKKLEKR